MEHQYKTLILVDQSSSISRGNREIIQAVLRYLVEHADSDTQFGFATITSDYEILKEFDVDRYEILDAIGMLTYQEEQTYVTDALMNIVNEWTQADLAMRDIILISDGLSNVADSYPVEELFMTLDKSSYPVYVLGCVQKDSLAAMKELAAVARISGGEMFYTDFEDSEASVEQKVGDAILKAMKERRTSAAEEETETAEDVTVTDTFEEPLYEESIFEEEINLTEYAEEAPKELFEGTKEQLEIPVISERLFTVFPLLLLGLVLLLIGYRILKRKMNHSASVQGQPPAPSFPEEVSRTTLLDSAQADSATRVLQGTDAVTCEFVLEDLDRTWKLFQLVNRDRILVGRKADCDVVLDYDDTVSSHHCELYAKGQQWYVKDLNSSNGTKRNGRTIQTESVVEPKDIITVGQVRLLIDFSGSFVRQEGSNSGFVFGS